MRFYYVKRASDGIGKTSKANGYPFSSGYKTLSREVKQHSQTGQTQKLRVRLGSCKTGLSPPVTLCY